ncbi:MAG TPA: CinA family protein [Candidatus Binataceae bacterium]|nr:CinA family protein [Candidatus Binataceae bacterium]
MQNLLPVADRLGAALKERHETIGVAESSTGGLISSALLAVPGASAYFLGGAIVYTRESRRTLLEIPDSAFSGIRSVTEELALVLARGALKRFAATWALAEVGAAGPTGNRYGDAAGHSCLAIAGPLERAITVETGSADRIANMRAFAAAGLELLERCLNSSPASR